MEAVMEEVHERLQALEAQSARIDERTKNTDRNVEKILQNCIVCRKDIGILQEKSWTNRLAILALVLAGGGGGAELLRVLGFFH